MALLQRQRAQRRGGYAPAPVMPERLGAAQQGRLVLRRRAAKALCQRNGAECPAPQRGERFVLLAPLPAVRLSLDGQRAEANVPSVIICLLVR